MNERMLTDALLNEFMIYLREDEKSYATIDKYMRDLKKFQEFAGEEPVSKQTVLDYKEHLAKGYAVASANSMLAVLNAFLRFAGWYECCVKRLKVQTKAYCSEDEELTRTEYVRLVNMAMSNDNERLALLIQTICGTGIRVSELEYITVESLEHGESQVNCKGKTRMIFIVPELREKLKEYADRLGIRSGPVFVTRTGNPMDRSNIWREMKALCDQAGVSETKVFPHNLRHLFARTFYGLEKDIAKLADVLGHTNISTTRIYIITTGEEHKKNMEKMQLIL